MFDDGGGEMLEMQAYKVVKNLTEYKGSAVCPQCGVIMNPVEAMYSLGLCGSCHEKRMANRVEKKLA
jgi:ribosomal protein S27AE